MLQISPQQFDVFQTQAEDVFIQSLKKALAEKYPHLLPSFPDAIQTKIVINMLDRAKSWGITWQSSLVIFSELMIAIAPNFDEEVEIRAILENNKKEINLIVKKITSHVSDKAWSKAEVTADDLPFFLTAQYLDKPLVKQIASAIQFVLWDKMAEIDHYQYAESACQYAVRLGLDGLNDAPLTLIAWRCLYGSNFNNPKVYSWVNDIINNKHQPRELVSMLKFRIALDYGRVV